MSIGLPVLVLGIVVALMVGIVLWVFTASSRSSEKRREDLRAKHASHQPWDAAGGRANR
jgi:lipopolysaccharide export LptBFGC system permease protein LptF